MIKVEGLTKRYARTVAVDNISFEVEEAFNIEIPDEALGTIKTVGDMVEGVTKLRAAAPPATAITP